MLYILDFSLIYKKYSDKVKEICYTYSVIKVKEEGDPLMKIGNIFVNSKLIREGGINPYKIINNGNNKTMK